MQIMTVSSAIRDYQVVFAETMDFISELETTKDHYYVIDKKVWDLYGSSFKSLNTDLALILPISEEVKCLETVKTVYDALMKCSAKRNMTLISIGGGIIQDITGFVASTLYRGINWIYVPTTLLAQADSCIGSKTSLNYQGYKNLIGTFFPPTKVFINTAFLSTLESEDFYSGLGEVIKLYMIGGESSATAFIKEIDKIKERDRSALAKAIQEVLQIKLQYIQEDEFDTGRRNLLNFGHCLGHAVESTTNFLIPHGQAVLMGILFANIVAKNRGLLSKSRYEFLSRELILGNICVQHTSVLFNTDQIFEAMKKDKKRVGEGLALIMMLDDYSLKKFQDLQYDELAAGMKELGATLRVPTR
ncbi:MAG: iron-containing alcohol dehydrogenase [Nitrospira sp. CG24A]|nr:MAG: iron-containing alcohol dehydrogenase [Nitrospira sp. CG24A]